MSSKNPNYRKEYYQKQEVKAHRKDYREKNKNKIKEQMKEYHKKWYQENKEKIGQKVKEYYQKPEVKIRIKKYKENYREKNKEKIREYFRQIYQKNKEIMKIRDKTQKLFRDSKIECENCGSKEDLQFHHLKPYRYDNFQILCRQCHLRIHGKEIIHIPKFKNHSYASNKV